MAKFTLPINSIVKPGKKYNPGINAKHQLQVDV